MLKIFIKKEKNTLLFWCFKVFFILKIIFHFAFIKSTYNIKSQNNLQYFITLQITR